MGKHSRRPRWTKPFEEMDLVMSTETTGAIPAQLTEEQQAEVFSEVFGITQQKPYDEE